MTLPTDRSEPLSWDLSPVDFRTTSLLRYLPFVFLGGYAGVVLVAGGLALPGLLANPKLLAVAVLLALVGGPASLLYLWPMIRDPDQRTGLDPRGWYEGMRPAGVIAAAVTGTILLLAGSAVTANATYLLGIVLLFMCPLFVLSIVDGQGRLDPESGTLTYQESSADVTSIDRVRCFRVGSVTLVWLGYAAGTSGPRPRLLTVPEDAADDVLAVLRAGANAPATVEPRDPDRVAQAVLVVFGFLFFVAAIGVHLFDPAEDAGIYVTVIAGGVGLACLLAARYVA